MVEARSDYGTTKIIYSLVLPFISYSLHVFRISKISLNITSRSSQKLTMSRFLERNTSQFLAQKYEHIPNFKLQVPTNPSDTMYRSNKAFNPLSLSPDAIPEDCNTWWVLRIELSPVKLHFLLHSQVRLTTRSSGHESAHSRNNRYRVVEDYTRFATLCKWI